MTIATLIAAGRLDERLVGAVRAALDRGGLRAGALEWIDKGDAGELAIEGRADAVRAALAPIDGLDVALRAGRRTAPRLFVADMDSTMIGQECIDELADYAGFKPQVAAITEQAMRGELDFVSALAARVALLEGLPVGTIAACLRERIRPTPGAATLVATMKRRGATTMLVSGGFSDFVDPVGRELGFEAMHANTLEVVAGRLTGRTVGAIVDAAAKRRFADDWLEAAGVSPEALVAIGDGANDAPLVERAGLGIGFRPKQALARVAGGIIRHHDLTAALWMQGIARAEWA